MSTAPRNRRPRWLSGLLAALVLLVAALSFALWRASPMLHSATASVSHSLCGAAFISRLDPDQVFREDQRPMAGMGSIAWALRYTVDSQARTVRTTALGGFASQAMYRPGFGCTLVDELPTGSQPVAELEPTLAAAVPLMDAIDPRLSPALDAAFAEVDARKLRQTKAIVVLHEGRVIAERYAPGYGPQTPIWGHSLTKSFTSALIGKLVQEGKLKVDQSIPAWQSANDARRTVTIDQLLRMDSGLPFDETNDSLSLATRLFMLERDTAGFAAGQPLASAPGTQWGYSNLSYTLLSKIVRDATGGDPIQTQAFIRQQLQAIGMQNATLEFDAAGTPMGAGFMYAPARDWARFGQLYLDDGVVDGVRLLPEGWVRYSASRTLASGYGAGFWTNLDTPGEIPCWGIEWGLSGVPEDAFFARGYLGQFIVIVPAARLVVVRLGMSHDTSAGVAKLTASILDTLKAETKP